MAVKFERMVEQRIRKHLDRVGYDPAQKNAYDPDKEARAIALAIKWQAVLMKKDDTKWGEGLGDTDTVKGIDKELETETGDEDV